MSARYCVHRGTHDTCDMPAAWQVDARGFSGRRSAWLCEEHARDALLDECADAECRNEHGDSHVVGVDGLLVEGP